MHPLAVLPGTCQPRGHGALIDSAGGDDGLGGTAVAQPSQDERHHIGGRPQSRAGRIFGGGERLATRGTAIALLRWAMHPNVPLPYRSSGRTLGVVAALGLRVHRWPPLN